LFNPARAASVGTALKVTLNVAAPTTIARPSLRVQLTLRASSSFVARTIVVVVDRLLCCRCCCFVANVTVVFVTVFVVVIIIIIHRKIRFARNNEQNTVASSFPVLVLVDTGSTPHCRRTPPETRNRVKHS
jgi:hypothetical protein